MAEVNGEEEIELIIAQSYFLKASLRSAIDSFEGRLPFRAIQYLKEKKDPKINEGLQVIKDKGFFYVHRLENTESLSFIYVF